MTCKRLRQGKDRHDFSDQQGTESSQTFQMGQRQGPGGVTEKWRLSIDPCTKWHFIWHVWGSTLIQNKFEINWFKNKQIGLYLYVHASSK